MSDKHLSGEEKRRKMKEEFKQELRKRKEFLEKVKHLKRIKRINEALANMNPQDDTEEWINKLNEETAFMEARTEIAMEGSKVINVPIEGPDDEPVVVEEAPEPKLSEEEIQRLAAEEMVRQMKEELASEMDAQANENAPRANPEAQEENENPEDRPHRKMMDGYQED